MNAIHPQSLARLLAAVACILLSWSTAGAQTITRDGPLPPPATAPESRLTVTPAEFAQWLAGLPPSDEPIIASDPDETPPSLVTAPPPPTLVTPPAPPRIAPVPTAAVPTMAPPGATTPDTPPQPPQPTLTPPPPPALQAPEEPRVATLPPDSPVTTPPATVPETLARPAAMKILYSEGVLELPDSAKPDLAKIAAWLMQNPSVRVQITGYATEIAGGGASARRTSLYRTLAVRKYLVENGVLSTRMDVRAQGDKTEDLPRDRVDISLPPS